MSEMKIQLTKFMVLILISVHAPAAFSQEPSIADVYRLPCRPADHRLFYGSDSLQFGDLRLPDGQGPHPVAIVIHGGCWVSFVADIRYTAPFADALRNDGIATWNIEYSRIGDPRGGWPGTFEDISKGVDFLRDLADEYNLDLERVVIVGHSAGAHLALWAAGRHKITSDSRIYTPHPLSVRGVVALAPPVDLENSVDLASKYCGDSLMIKLVGGLPSEVPSNYGNASPMSLLPTNIPQRLLVGELDMPELVEQITVYADSAMGLGEDISLDTVQHVWHNELAIPGSICWLKVRATIKALLDKPD